MSPRKKRSSKEVASSSDSKPNGELQRSESDEIMENLKYRWYEKILMRLMSPEEREAFIIAKVDAIKKRREKQAERDGK